MWSDGASSSLVKKFGCGMAVNQRLPLHILLNLPSGASQIVHAGATYAVIERPVIEVTCSRVRDEPAPQRG